jgi:hypothetical protein
LRVAVFEAVFRETLRIVRVLCFVYIERSSHVKERPVGVTILAILAGIAAVIAAVHALQFLGIIPFFFSPSGIDIHVHYVSFWYALMYGLLVWVYIWLTMALWRVEPGAWVFLVVVTMFYLILDLFSLIGVTTWADVGVSIIINGLILLYCMLPGVKAAFGTQS